MRQQILIIPGELTTMNKMTLQNRTHWAVGAKNKKENTHYITSLCDIQKIKPVKNPPDFDVVFYRKDKRTEKDNCLSQMKDILDGLVMAGVLEDDRWDNYGGMSFDWVIDSKNPRIEVSIIDEL